MRTVVTVFKNDLSQRELVKSQVKSLCKEIKELENATVFCPKDGKLVEFLGVLRFHKITYGTHFDTKDEETFAGVLKQRI